MKPFPITPLPASKSTDASTNKHPIHYNTMTMLPSETDTKNNVHCCRHAHQRRMPSCTASPSSVLMSTNKAARVMPRTSSTRLRSNLLHKLGIPPTESVSSSALHNPSNHHSHRSLLGNVEAKQVPLKEIDERYPPRMTRDDPTTGCRVGGHTATDTVFQALGSLWTGQPMDSSLRSASSTSTCDTHEEDMSLEDTSSTTGAQRRQVHFDSHVTVVPIPHRSDYSQRIRCYLWNAPEDMQRDVVRNTLEFTADGWDWQAAAEENEHYYSPLTREYIHPVHLEISQMPLEDQEAILPANYVNPAVQQQQQPQQPHDSAELSTPSTWMAMDHPPLSAANTTMPHPLSE